MKTSNLLFLISVPILMLSCAEQPTADCQKEQIQIEELKQELLTQDSLIERLKSASVNFLASEYDHLALIVGEQVGSAPKVLDYKLIFRVNVPKGAKIESVSISPQQPSKSWDVAVKCVNVPLSEAPNDRWVSDSLVLPNNMTLQDINEDGVVTHWNNGIPGDSGELDQSSQFVLTVIDPSNHAKPSVPYMLKRATIKSLDLDEE